MQKAKCCDRVRVGFETDVRKRFSHIGRREAEFAEGNLLVLHDESPVTTETRFMGLTPRGPRPLPSPSPSIFGAPTVRQVGRGTRDIARGRYDPMAGPWLEALKPSKRSGENARTWLFGSDSAIIAVFWSAAFSDRMITRLTSSHLCALL